MKLYGSLTSPFVRAVRIAAIELGLADKLVLEPTVTRPTEPNRPYGAAVNPLRRVPALETDAGDVIIDSRVILEFLNAEAGGTLIPADAGARIDCLNRHAVAAGGTEALVLCMYEKNIRPAEYQWSAWLDDQLDKAGAALDWAEARTEVLGATFDLAAISFACFVDYGEFRFPEQNWMKGRPAFATLVEEWRTRPSVKETAPPDA